MFPGLRAAVDPVIGDITVRDDILSELLPLVAQTSPQVDTLIGVFNSQCRVC